MGREHLAVGELALADPDFLSCQICGNTNAIASAMEKSTLRNVAGLSGSCINGQHLALVVLTVGNHVFELAVV